MARILRDNSTTAKAPEKEKENLQKEYKFLTALSQMGMNFLLEKVKNKEITLTAKDLQILLELKRASAKEDLGDVNFHFKSCNACLFDKTCTLYKSGSSCRLSLNTEIHSPQDSVQVMRQLMMVQQDRIQRGLLIEKSEGNHIDPAISEEIMNYFEMAAQMKSVLDQNASVTIHARGPAGGGVLSEIFSGLLPKPVNSVNPPQEKIVETVAEPVLEPVLEPASPPPQNVPDEKA